MKIRRTYKVRLYTSKRDKYDALGFETLNLRG